jgi:hypothetical protein
MRTGDVRLMMHSPFLGKNMEKPGSHWDTGTPKRRLAETGTQQQVGYSLEHNEVCALVIAGEIVAALLPVMTEMKRDCGRGTGMAVTI